MPHTWMPSRTTMFRFATALIVLLLIGPMISVTEAAADVPTRMSAVRSERAFAANVDEESSSSAPRAEAPALLAYVAPKSDMGIIPRSDESAEVQSEVVVAEPADVESEVVVAEPAEVESEVVVAEPAEVESEVVVAQVVEVVESEVVEPQVVEAVPVAAVTAVASQSEAEVVAPAAPAAEVSEEVAAVLPEPQAAVSTVVDAEPVAQLVVPPASAQVPAAPTTTASARARIMNQLPASVSQWMTANGWRIDWRQGPGPGRIAEAQYSTSTIVIWYESSRPDSIWVGAVGHELGHAVSFANFSPQQMSEWNALRGLSSWRWVPGTPNDFSVGEGDFAEAFMSYLLGHQVRSVGGPLSAADRAWIAANTTF